MIDSAETGEVLETKEIVTRFQVPRVHRWKGKYLLISHPIQSLHCLKHRDCRQKRDHYYTAVSHRLPSDLIDAFVICHRRGKRHDDNSVKNKLHASRGILRTPAGGLSSCSCQLRIVMVVGTLVVIRSDNTASTFPPVL